MLLGLRECVDPGVSLDVARMAERRLAAGTAWGALALRGHGGLKRPLRDLTRRSFGLGLLETGGGPPQDTRAVARRLACYRPAQMRLCGAPHGAPLGALSCRPVLRHWPKSLKQSLNGR